MSFIVYILRTSSNTLYIGQTNNLNKRIREHQLHKAKSAKYIRYFGSFKLVYHEEFETRIQAMKRERQLKKWTKAKKIVDVLTSGKWTHDYPITYDEAKRLGFSVNTQLPEEIYQLMDLYSQASNTSPSVYYIPTPYQKESELVKRRPKIRILKKHSSY